MALLYENQYTKTIDAILKEAECFLTESHISPLYEIFISYFISFVLIFLFSIFVFHFLETNEINFEIYISYFESL